jgi:hypothetical protein
MANATIAHDAHPSTRESRGLALFEEYGELITFEHGVWYVPSRTDVTTTYEVTLGTKGEFCECKDFGYRGGPCQHIHAATIARAKTAPCASCGRRFRHRELFEVQEDHESLTWFPGDKLCRQGCAGPGGVL